MPGQYNKVPARAEIKIGDRVKILQKKDYESEEITEGVVKRILTSKPVHPRGIKVMLASGVVGRVQALGDNPVVPLDESDSEPEKEVDPSDLPGPDDLV